MSDGSKGKNRKYRLIWGVSSSRGEGWAAVFTEMVRAYLTKKVTSEQRLSRSDSVSYVGIGGRAFQENGWGKRSGAEDSWTVKI